VYEWKGADDTLKPILLTSHQDVVPVLEDTRPLWTHDPYGGEVDGDRIWGRGSTDDKSGLIGSFAAVELLIESGLFTPQRTVILGLGYDEEAAGKVSDGIHCVAEGKLIHVEY
jgi:Gly-Xaa carboxypeptidase